MSDCEDTCNNGYKSQCYEFEASSSVGKDSSSVVIINQYIHTNVCRKEKIVPGNKENKTVEKQRKVEVNIISILIDFI